MGQEFTSKEKTPLENIEDWEADLKVRYPKPKTEETKEKSDYRNYHDSERVDTVKEFYRLNHQYQTVDFVKEKQKEFLTFDKKEMSFGRQLITSTPWWMILTLILV